MESSKSRPLTAYVPAEAPLLHPHHRTQESQNWSLIVFQRMGPRCVAFHVTGIHIGAGQYQSSDIYQVIRREGDSRETVTDWTALVDLNSQNRLSESANGETYARTDFDS